MYDGSNDPVVHPYNGMSDQAVEILQFIEDHSGEFTYEQLKKKFSSEDQALNTSLHRSLGGLLRERLVIGRDGNVYLSDKHVHQWKAWLRSEPARTRVPEWIQALVR